MNKNSVRFNQKHVLVWSWRDFLWREAAPSMVSIFVRAMFILFNVVRLLMLLMFIPWILTLCAHVLQCALYHFEQPTPTEHLQILNYGYYRPLKFQQTQLSGLEQSWAKQFAIVMMMSMMMTMVMMSMIMMMMMMVMWMKWEELWIWMNFMLTEEIIWVDVRDMVLFDVGSRC